MFIRVFSIVMTPAVALVSVLSLVIYFYWGVSMAVDGDTGAAIFWFLVWGHILSVLVAAIIAIPSLAVIALFAAAAAGLFSLAWRLQQKGLENLPFTVHHKDSH